jgi:hypothetical protein
MASIDLTRTFEGTRRYNGNLSVSAKFSKQRVERIVEVKVCGSRGIFERAL